MNGNAVQHSISYPMPDGRRTLAERADSKPAIHIRRSRWVARFVLLVAIAFGLRSPSLLAADQVTIESVRVGIENHFRLGCWTQVRFDLKSSVALEDVRMEVTLPDGEGAGTTHVNDGIELVVGDSTVVTNLKFGRAKSDMAIRLWDSKGECFFSQRIPAAEMPTAVLASQFLVVSLGQELGVGESVSLRREKASQRTEHCEITSANSLPDHWLGYRGVNLLAISTSPQSVATQMTDAQVDAVKQWVRMGGRVLLCAGQKSAPVIQEGTAWSELLPGIYDGVRMQRDTGNFEAYAGKTKTSLANYLSASSARLPMAVLRDVEGRIELSEGLGTERTPAIVRSSFGFGQVLFLAVDLDQSPFSEWKEGRRRVLRRLVDMALGELPSDESTQQYSQLTQIGFSDLTGQLRSALDQFRNNQLVPFSLIAILIGSYILLIGPVDYFLLRRWKKRFGLTWITFPLTVLAACALAFWLTQLWKNQTVEVNQVAVVDIEARSGLMRGTAWAHVFSPANQKYDCQLNISPQLFPGVEFAESLTSWQGLPGSSFGGMNTRRKQGPEMDYRIAHGVATDTALSRVQAMPISIYGSRSIHGMGWGEVPSFDFDRLRAEMDDRVTGTVTNPLPISLKNCQLCFGRWVYPLQSMGPGGSQTIQKFAQPKSLDVILTKKRVDQDFKGVSEPWDRKGLDVARIMQVMMFYDAAGGLNYTSLLNRYQRDIDFSDHLTQERAILIGTVNDPGLDLLDAEAGERQATTFVRILLPITRD